MIFREEKGDIAASANYEQPPIQLAATANSSNDRKQKSENRVSRSIGDRLYPLKKWCRKHVSPANLLTLAIALAAWEQFYATQGQLSVMKNQVDEMRRSGQASTEQVWRAIDNMNWLARTMQASLGESQIARDTSERRSKSALDASIQSSRTDQRAWIAVSSPKMTNEPNIQKDYSVFVDTTNVGRTPGTAMTFKSSTGFIRSAIRLPR